MTLFTQRPMGDAPGERGFCAKSWVESFSSSAMAELVSRQGAATGSATRWTVGQEYWSTWHALVDALLDRGRTTVMVDEDGLLAGFLCWEPWDSAVCVHYVYVRALHRKRGVARLLLEALPGGPRYYTHRSRGIARVPEGWTYTLRPLIGAVRQREAA